MKYAPQKPKRFPIGERISNKAGSYFSVDETNSFLNQEVLVTEKMDGKTTEIDIGRYVIIAEDMKIVHSIKYRVPARYAVFDVYDKETGLYLLYYNIYKIVKEYRYQHNLFLIPPIDDGVFSIGDIWEFAFGKSRYAVKGEHKEGSVIRPHEQLNYDNYITGKIVRTEFLEGLTTHYLRKKRELNIIDPYTKGRIEPD